MRKAMWIICGILLIFSGVYLIFNPAIALNSVATMIGIVILAQGITEICDYADYAEAKWEKFWIIMSGILSIILGILAVFSPLNIVLTAMLPYIFGSWVLARGICQCVKSIYLKKLSYTIWGYVLTFGIINCLLGILMITNPIIPAFTIAFTAGTGLMMMGVSAVTVGM